MAFSMNLPGTLTLLLTMATLALIYAQLVLGLNIHFGFTGILDFGYVAFFAAGAYTSALLTMPPPGPESNLTIGLGLPMPGAVPISLLGAAIAGAILALLIGLTSIRLDSHYLAIATFALAGVFHAFLTNEKWLTDGVYGLTNVPKAGTNYFSGDAWVLFYFVFTLVVTAGMLFVISRLMDAPFGRLLKGIREDADGAEMLGKNVTRKKLQAFVVGGAVAGFAGGMYAHFIGSVLPAQFLAVITFFVWTGMLIGGAGSNYGAILGGIVFVALRDFTRFVPSFGYDYALAQFRFVIIGAALILIIRFYPQGILGTAGDIVEKEQ